MLARAGKPLPPVVRATRASGLTLIELILAVASTALIALAIATMLFAMAKGTSSRTDLRSVVVKHKTLTARFDAAVRSSSAVLARGSDYVVLWMGDTRENGAPNLSELRRIEYDAAGNTIVSYTAELTGTAAQIEAADTTYQFSDNFEAITAGLKGDDEFPAETWATRVSGWTVTLNDATATDATLVRYRFVLAADELTDTVVGAAALRAP
jgi:hypothetical protein